MAVLGTAAAAVLARKPGDAERAPAAAAASGARGSAAPAGALGEAATSLSGKVMERMDVPKYTYLSLDTGGGGGRTWVAVASADVKVGQSVRIVDAQLMTNFESTTLKRTFDAIYFGMLENGATPKSPKADFAHGTTPDADPHAGIPGAPALTPGAAADGRSNPHGQAMPSSDKVVVGTIVKAEGPSGRTVRETYEQRRALAGKSVRVRGVVVKVISGVLGRSFVHIRDGSETSALSDLLVTTQAVPAVGERVLFAGKVSVDKDFGAGYAYPVLIEDAELVGERTTTAL